MESYYAMLRRKAREADKRALLNALGEVAGAILFFVLLLGTCFLCTICSGYHWE